MLEIPLFVLVLQIGFNAALSYLGNNQKLLIPSSRSINYEQTRRSISNRYLPLSSRRIPASDSDQSDSEDSSLEESSYRALLPLQSLPYQRRNSLRYNTRTDNDMSLEMAPVGKIGSDAYSDTYQSALHITKPGDTNVRRPYFRDRTHNFRQKLNRKYLEREDSDVSLEVPFVDQNSNLNSIEDSSEEDATYRRSLLSLIEQPNLRRRQNLKYNRKGDNKLSIETSPVDGLDEDAVESHETSSEASLIDTSYRESVLSNHKQSYNRQAGGNFAKPQLRNLEINHGNNKKYRRKHGYNTNLYDKLNTHDDNNPYDRQKLDMRLKSHKIINESPSLSLKHYKKKDASIDLHSLFSDALNSDDDSSDNLSVSSIENSPKLKSRNQNQQNNRQYLRLAVSPNDELTLDEDLASSISVLLAHNLNGLNLVPATNLKNNRRNNNDAMLVLSLDDGQSAEEDTSSNLSALRLESFANSNKASQLVRNRKSRKSYNVRTSKRGDLVPYHEHRSSVPTEDNNKKGKHNRRYNDGFDDEFSIDSLFNYRKDHDDTVHELSSNDRLDIDDNAASDLSFLDETSLNGVSEVEPDRKDTNTLHLDFPWNHQLTLDDDDDDENSNLSVFRGLKSASRSHEDSSPSKDPKKYELKLEYPWNGDLSPHNYLSRSQLRIRENADKIRNNETKNYELNGQLSLDKNKNGNLSKSQLRRIQNSENLQKSDPKNYELQLEYPWNGDSSPDDSLAQSQLRSRQNSENLQKKDPKKYELKLEYPWNGDPSPDDSLAQSQLRSRQNSDNLQKKDPKNYELKLEYPWTSDLNPEDRLSQPQLRSRENFDNLKKNYTKNYESKLEYQWNDNLGPDDNKNDIRSKSRLRSRNLLDSLQNTDPENYALKLDYPWIGDLKPDSDENSIETVVRELKSRLRTRESTEDLQVKHSKRDLVPVEKIKKPVLRAARVLDPSASSEYKYRRSGRRTNADFNIGDKLPENLDDSQSDDKYYLKKTDRRLNEDSRRVLSLDDTDSLNSAEDTSGSINFSLDRRPHRRLRSRDEKQSYGPVATTVGSNIVRTKTYNDTIIFPKN